MSISKPVPKRTALIVGLYIIMLLINLVLITPKMGSFALGIVRTRHEDGMWRSARFGFSGNFANYIRFLREQIPEDGLVVLPPREVSTWALSDKPTMQFFLTPRELINCNSVECGSKYIGRENTYILIMGLNRYPDSGIRNQEDNFRMHNDTWGIYGPADGLGKGSNSAPVSGFAQIGHAPITPILAVLLLAILGFYFGAWLLPGSSPWSKLGAGIGMLLGMYSFFGYFIMILGLGLSPSLIFSLLTIIFVVILIYALARKKFSLREISSLFDCEEGFNCWILAILTLGLGLVILAVGTGFHETDSTVLWGAKALGIIRDGLEGMVNRGTNTTTYPMHLPLILSMFLDAFGFTLPAAKIIFPLYYLSLLFLVYGFFARKTEPTLAGLSTLVLGTMPLIVRHGMIAYANLPLTFYLVGAVIFIQMSIEKEDSGLGWVLPGIWLALAAWTRPEGIWLGVGILAAFFSLHLFRHRWKGLLDMWWIIVPPALVYVFWIISRKSFYTTIVPLEGNITIILGDLSTRAFHFQDLTQIAAYLLNSLFDFRIWGLIGWGVVAALLLAVLFWNQNRISVDGLILIEALLVTLLISLLYYMFSFLGNYSVTWWLGGGYDRMIMPGMVLLWLGISMAINSVATAGGEPG